MLLGLGLKLALPDRGEGRSAPARDAWLAGERGSQQAGKVVSEALVGPTPLDGQSFDHVRGDERPQHVRGAVDRPKGHELTFAMEPRCETPAVRSLSLHHVFVVSCRIGINPTNSVDGAGQCQQARMVSRQVPGPLVERGHRILSGPHWIGRGHQPFGLCDERKKGADQLRSGREMQVDGASRDAGALRDTRHRQGVESLFLDDRAGRSEQRCASSSTSKIGGATGLSLMATSDRPPHLTRVGRSF